MNIRGIIFVTFLAVSAFAKQPKVRQAWVNTYPHQALSIISDNIGHLVVFGSEIDEYGTPTNSAPLTLLNSHGKEIASFDGIAGKVAADTAGRIFVLSSDSESPLLRCTAFAPRLARLLWSNEKEIPNGHFGSRFANIHRFLPDENGGAGVFGSLSVLGNLEFFVVNLGSLWSVTHPAGYMASAHFVTLDHEENIIVLCSHGVTKYSPDGALLWQVVGNFLKCQVDRFGNVFLAQENTNESRVDTPLVVKLAANGQRLWEAALYDDQPTQSSYISGLVCDEEGGVYVSAPGAAGDLIMRFVENGPKPQDRTHPVRPQKR